MSFPVEHARLGLRAVRQVRETGEELVAEMGAAFLSGYCGIENRTINNSAAYLASWLDTLKNDHRMVLIAAIQAQKAADLILGVARTDVAQQPVG